MNQHTGFWWELGDFFLRCFHGLEWTYNHLSPNKVFIGIAFVAFFIWLKIQNDYNKKALKEGTLK